MAKKFIKKGSNFYIVFHYFKTFKFSLNMGINISKKLFKLY